MKEITHPSAIRLITDLLDRIPKTKSGTYNRADPTMYEKGETTYRGLHLKYWDCTWGIEITISTDHNGRPGIELAGIYYTWEQKWNGKGWTNKPMLIPRKSWNNKWFIILKGIMPGLYNYAEQRRREEQNYEPDPMGSLSDYE